MRASKRHQLHECRSSAVSANLAIAMISLVLAAGCGGDGGDDSASKEEFVTAANMACTKAKERIAANTERIPEELRSVDPFGPDQVSPNDLRRLAPTTAELGDIYRELRDDLEQIEPPSADAGRIEKALDDLGEGAKEFEEAAASFQSGIRPHDKSPIAAIAAPSRVLADYGADTCLHSGN